MTAERAIAVDAEACSDFVFFAPDEEHIINILKETCEFFVETQPKLYGKCVNLLFFWNRTNIMGGTR